MAETAGGVGSTIGTESSLSNWGGDYVTDMLGQGQALAEMPYEGYNGPLTAGASDLQQDAFGGIAGLTLPDDYSNAADMASGAWASTGDYMGDNNITTDTWNNDFANEYMNPFIQQSLNPQLEELRRQNQIQTAMDNSRLSQSGAYGGSRQAIMNSESNDNTARLMSEITGKGYNDAYESAGRMFTSDRGRMLDADRAGADTGLRALDTKLRASGALTNAADAGLDAERDIYGDKMNAGAVQRGITSEGIAADKAQFEEERDFPYKSVQYMHSLLDGMPLAAQNNTYSQPSWLQNFAGGAAGTGGIADIIKQFFPDGVPAAAAGGNNTGGTA